MRTLHPLMIFYGAIFLVIALIWIVRSVPVVQAIF